MDDSDAQLVREVNRGLEQWVRNVLISLYVEQGSSLCEVLCGPGADLGKLQRAGIEQYVGIEHVPQCIQKAQQEARKYRFSANIFRMDPSKYCLRDRIEKVFDSVVCFGRLEHNFSKAMRALNFINNVASILRPGGIFFGFTVDTASVWEKAQAKLEEDPTLSSTRDHPSVLLSVECPLFTIEFPKVDKASRRPNRVEHMFREYGSLYTLKLKDGSKSTQFMFHMPSVLKMCEKVGLKCLHMTNFRDFYNEHRFAFPEGLPGRALSEDQLELAGMYTVFAFVRT